MIILQLRVMRYNEPSPSNPIYRMPCFPER